jgi:membrane protein YdbS with pleckstrin-like domain
VTADEFFWVLVAVAVLVALIAIWRVWVHDKTIRRVRFGFFWERERDDSEEDR